MFCDELLEWVEPIAAGDLQPTPAAAAHLGTCPGCARALAAARRVDRLLRARPVPQPAPQFTAKVLSRVRRERWRTEQRVDAAFNAVVALVIAVAAFALWAALANTGIADATTQARDLMVQQFVDVVRRAAPALPLYGAAIGLLGSALGLWWWAERGTAP